MGYIQDLRAQIGTRTIKVPGGRAILANPDGEVLLQKRTDFGIWGLPAGCPEANETALESIVREVREETGLTMLDPLCIGYSSNPDYESIQYPNGDLIHCYSLIFVATSWRGEMIEHNEETEQLAFFAPDLLPELLPNMRRSIEMYRRYCATGEFQLD